MTNKPWMKWYPADWRADPRLRMCGLGARGLWIELIGYMHESHRYGYLLIGDMPPSVKQIATLVGEAPAVVQKALDELSAAGVFSREGEIIYSRRMVRDKAKAEVDRENGKQGGNPKLKLAVYGGVNPPHNQEVIQKDKAARGRAPAFQKPDTREEDSDASASDGVSPSKPLTLNTVKELWDRGLAILGADRRSLLGKYRQAYGDVIVLAAIVECEKEQPSDPAAYFVACCERRKSNAAGSSESAISKLGSWAMGEDEQESVRGNYQASVRYLRGAEKLGS